MTVTKMQAIWKWFAARMEGPPQAPGMRVGLLWHQRAAGQYLAGTVTVRPWADRLVVIHEYAHHYWYKRGVADTVAGIQFLKVIGHDYWDQEAKEIWCATLVGVLTGKWGKAICQVKPSRKAAWTFTALVRGEA